MSSMRRRLLPSPFQSLRILKTNSFSISSLPRQELLSFDRFHHERRESRVLSQLLAHRHFSAYSTKTTTSTQRCGKVEVMEFSASNLSGSKNKKDGALRTLRSMETENVKTWDIIQDSRETKKGNLSSLQHRLQSIPKNAIALLLPAQYPQSVVKGYLGFVSFCFTASIAGSAAMVLSTQTLLLAVGIVGQSSSTTAGVMAGALNWVMKDFVGQLGGILFASQMGKTKAFDSDPKRFRMMAAISLDGATFLEILSPLCHPSLVLPIASIANIGKNIGFLTASASRAALHQSLAVTGNLGDVTVKAGSQSMMASLLGTSLGIGISTLLHHDVFNFGICFLGLSAIHQGCTYLSLQNVPLAHFNRHRLHLAMEYYLKHQTIPSPFDVAKFERFFPFVHPDASKEWLHIGRPLKEICPNPNELENCLAAAPNESYLIRWNEKTLDIDLVFLKDANEQDLCRGIYHAYLIRYKTEMANEELRPRDVPSQEITQQTHVQVQQNFPHLFEQLHAQGWDTSSGVTDIEDEKAHRIQIKVV